MNTNVPSYYGVDAPSAQIDPLFYILYYIVVFAMTIVTMVAMWKMFVKAGRRGWEAIVPLYNMYVLLQIIGKPGWWIILYLIPFANIVVSLLVSINLGKAFGKSTLFSVVFLWLFSIVGYLILAFGDDTYKGQGSTMQSPSPASQPPMSSQVTPQPQTTSVSSATPAPASASQRVANAPSETTPLDQQATPTQPQNEQTPVQNSAGPKPQN